jgi:hypothetical protein
MSNSTNKLFAKLAHGFANDPKIVGLSHEAFRAYIELLLYSCQNMTDGFLDDRIVRRMGWDDEAKELTQNDAEPSFIRVDGGYQIHAFCDWQMTTEAHQRKVEAGRAGGLAKAEARRQASKPVAGASDVLEQTASKSLLDKEVDKEEDIDNKHTVKESRESYSDEFETWWTAYPKKVAKGTAVKAWKGAISKTSIGVLLDSVKAYAIKVANTEQQYILHAATWLNQERWNDEPEPVKWNLDAWMNEDVKWGDARYE